MDEPGEPNGRRSVYLHVRCSPAEKTAIEVRARLAGVSASRLLRDAALGAHPGVERAVLTRELFAIRRALRIADDTSDGEVDLSQKLNVVMARLDRVLDELEES